MQLMGDSISVFGGRFGIALDPAKKCASMIRHDAHPGLPFEIAVGFDLNGNRSYLPLSSEGKTFEFCDFDATATSMRIIGIEPSSGIRVSLKVMIPFRPRDIEFSVTPVIFIDVECERIENDYRWVRMEDRDRSIKGRFFIELKNATDSSVFKYVPLSDENRIKIEYKSPYRDLKLLPKKYMDSENYLEILSGLLEGRRVFGDFSLLPGQKAKPIKLALVAYDEPVLQVLGEKVPFKYSQYFKNIDEVSKWARENRELVEENSRKVDGIFASHTMGQAYGHLMIQTLHTWLSDTWFTVRSNGQDWFSCWEGNCYFHSTVDVEYTQTPFYLSVWPELLRLLIDEWCYYGKPGNIVRGLEEKGNGTIVMSHDMGEYTLCDKQIYPHEMPVEENANYILMVYAYYLRTGEAGLIYKHKDLLSKLLDFILACDSTGNGIPELGTANTVDDGSPAVQYCSEQIYLGVKAIAAVEAGMNMLLLAGENGLEKYQLFVDRAIKTIEEQGWVKDHYVVTTMRTLDGLFDSWSNKPVSGEAEGWDAYHIYTTNGLTLLDMCGYKTGISEEHIKTDLQTALEKTKLKYGSSHSSYRKEGISGHPSKIGWISMNMLRDISAAYRGLDFFSMSEGYWDWQLVSNTQEYMGFHETFYGNTLCFYPRGIACFGYLDAALGFVFSPVLNKKSFAPVRSNLKVPLLLFADWKEGNVPIVTTGLVDGRVVYRVDDFHSK